ncbi:hypothetical protein FW778_02930 [Ginsengibacter hankyongi]|uniref:SIS domain-containing protein n=1 Tax=Ginsengibacter hankyongi TaxID=2607284 RepID=A0A5J5IJ03_9BACT|nr:hypothetical protein [Ginsengibacter hankyongi]KAA9041009.1 hypothetical protein FW778_02930 [Ginsengibacter hankyongi]
MGKPFIKEIRKLPETIEWAKKLNLAKLAEIVNKFHHPVYIVGSGGSFSACVYAADLLTAKGIFAKAITPLELFYAKSTIRKSNLVFISASGRNTDILFAFKKAIESEPISIVNICMRKKSKLAALSENYSCCTTFEFEPPYGKDGFLATNSLIAFFVILFRSITNQFMQNEFQPLHKTFYIDFIKRIGHNTCFTILYGSFHHAVAVDLESKFSEAGLAPSLVSDYRHFAHGRHQWFDKKKDSAIIALTCPADEKLCLKTLQLLPEGIPKLVFNSHLENFDGTIELLLQSMELIGLYGIKQGIDPGRPGVPDYGSKIYHLRYEKLISNQGLSTKDVAIVRKAKVTKLSDLSHEQLKDWEKHYLNFIKKISVTKFGSLIFDYDGTLCSSANRFVGLNDEIKSLLINFVKKGFVLGIVSGRGKSLREDLERAFNNDPELMKNVMVGYYNGSDIAPLSNAKHPNKSNHMHPSLVVVKNQLIKIGINPDESPNQLTLGSKTTEEWNSLKEILLNEIMLLDLSDITMVESSHSIDIIPRKIASKNHMLNHCRKLCKSLGLPVEALCIGDKGQWPGNDYELLANEYALSVGEVSSFPKTGWNMFPPGLRDEKAVSYLFGKLKMKKGYFTLTDL